MTNQLVVQNAEAAIEQMKLEIAQELGIQYGADATARDNGKIGGQIVKRLIALGEASLAEQSINNPTTTRYNNVHQDQLH